MLKFALYDYVPQRFIDRTSFEQQDTNRMILDFKDGRNYASRWAAQAMAYALHHADLKDVVIACVPASSTYSHARRYKRFSAMLCKAVGAIDGYEHVTVSGSRKRAHLTGEYELCDRFDELVHIDTSFFHGKKVIVVDDVCTTCRSANAFINALEDAGADVRLALFLAKTKRYLRRC